MQKLLESVKSGAETTKISLVELSMSLQRIDGGSNTIFNMTCAVDPNLYKKGNPFAKEDVRKITRYFGKLNTIYANSVNRQLEREGKEANFEAQANWHEKKYDQINGCVVRKQNKDGLNTEYVGFIVDRAETLGYSINGVEATTEETAIIKGFRKPTTTPQNQGTDKPIIYRTIKLQNVKLIKIIGEHYEIK